MENRRPALRIVKSSLDGHVDRALEAMKNEPSRRWTVAALGRAAGLSRAALARRFTKTVGVPPLRWLAEHRLRLAQRRLVETDLSLAAIAADVGYRCEFAFAKAFKRVVGLPPGVFRRMAVADVFRAAA
jgi:transcriptional regulator GlxA family with amidase domain